MSKPFDYETDSEQFKEEVKQILAGYISDPNALNYVSLKLRGIYECHREEVVRCLEKD